jgi:hypothetical protein
MYNQIKIKQTELLSDNWYTLNKVTLEYQKKWYYMDNSKEKFMTEVMARLFYCTIQKIKLSF